MKKTPERIINDQFRFVFCAFLFIVCGVFILVAIINWLNGQETAFYKRPSVAASSLHALRKMIFIIFNPEASLPDSWGPMLSAYETFVTSNASIYIETFFKQGIRFQYPPSSLLTIDLIKLLYFEPHIALPKLNIVFFFLFASTNGFIAVLSFKKLFVFSPWKKYILFSIGFGLPFFFYPLIHALNMGQVQIWIDAFIALSVLAWLKNRKTLAGAMAGLTCLFKPQACILLLWSIASRDWRFVRGFLGIFFTIISASILRFGLSNHDDYFDVLRFLSKHGESFYANQSLMGLLHRLVGNGPNLIWEANSFPVYIPWIYFVASLTSLSLLAFLMWLSDHTRDRGGISAFACAMIVTILSAPIAWEHHYGAVLPFFIPVLAQAFSRHANFRFYALLGLAWIMMANYLPVLSRFAESSLNPVQSYVFFGGIIFLFATARMTLWSAHALMIEKTHQSIKAAPEA